MVCLISMTVDTMWLMCLISMTVGIMCLINMTIAQQVLLCNDILNDYSALSCNDNCTTDAIM